jgi:molecular chaperone DnaK (HSP70)
LSSNKDVFIKLPELDGYINLEITISREQFEKAIKVYADKIEAAIKRIIEKSGLSINGIHSFEIIGGGL